MIHNLHFQRLKYRWLQNSVVNEFAVVLSYVRDSEWKFLSEEVWVKLVKSPVASCTCCHNSFFISNFMHVAFCKFLCFVLMARENQWETAAFFFLQCLK